MNRFMPIVVAATLALALMTVSHAAGPVNGEVDAVYWANDFRTETGTSAVEADGSAPGLRGEVWFLKKYGVRAGQYKSEPEFAGSPSSDFSAVDFLWRAVSPTEQTFFALGAGWGRMDLSSAGFGDAVAGARLNAEGRIGLVGAAYLYAQASYYPSLDDAPASNPALGQFRDLSGMDLELGARWKLAPFVHLRAGYRSSDVDFTFVDTLGGQTGGSVESSGFFAGLGVHF